MASRSGPPLTRRRRWAPKCKTGCTTCKIRKLKCDEQKPICNRCIAAGVCCGGLGYSYAVGNDATVAPKTTRGVLVASIAPAPPFAPQLNGSAAARDLLDLVPQVAKYVHYTLAESLPNADKENLLLAGRQLTLYLDYLPSRLGLSETLDKTIACVASTLRDICLPPNCRSPAKTLSSYTQALNALQRSLRNKKECLLPEILCAVQLFGIFETLINGSKQLSSTHRQGLCQIYQLRGPERFHTDFEYALLISQTPIIFSDASFSATDCFLDHPDWISTVQSASKFEYKSFHLSEFRVSRYEFMIPMGRMVKTCSRIILSHGPMPDLEQMRQAALEEVATLLRISENWLVRWRRVLRPSQRHSDYTFLGEGDSREAREHAGFLTTAYVLGYMRLYIALGGPNAVELETRGLAIATDLLKCCTPRCDAFLVFDVMFARIAGRLVLDTTQEWQSYIQRTQGSGQLIEQDIWVRFLRKWGATPGSIPPPLRWLKPNRVITVV